MNSLRAFVGHCATIALTPLLWFIPTPVMGIDCQKSESALEKAACTVDLQDQLGEIDRAYARLRTALPPGEIDALLSQQDSWAQQVALMCAVQTIAAQDQKLRDSLSFCLNRHFQGWKEWLDGYHRRIGGLESLPAPYGSGTTTGTMKYMSNIPRLQFRKVGVNKSSTIGWPPTPNVVQKDSLIQSLFVRRESQIMIAKPTHPQSFVGAIV
jgi:hypothetical protein